jgi:hypothetical protein
MLILSGPCTQIDGQLEPVWCMHSNVGIKVVLVIRGDQECLNCGPHYNARSV